MAIKYKNITRDMQLAQIQIRQIVVFDEADHRSRQVGRYAAEVAHVLGGDVRHPVGSRSGTCCRSGGGCLRCGFRRFIRLRFVTGKKHGSRNKAQGEEQRLAGGIGRLVCHTVSFDVCLPREQCVVMWFLCCSLRKPYASVAAL